MSTTDLTMIYFSDFFEVSPEILEEFGAFDISLINDLPLFIDPFLLFNSTNPEYQKLHDELIQYIRFLRDKAIAGSVPKGLLEGWFTFREVKQTWLGYSQSGNRGSGLGMDFALGLSKSLSTEQKNFGEKDEITHGSHIEKLCLVSAGIGRDNISDFTTNLIKKFLLEFTQRFAQAYLREDQRRIVPIGKTVFNYETETWVTEKYELPFINDDYVILTEVAPVF